MTPDAQSKRLGTETTKAVCNENVLFEAGAAYGRYGLKRVILVKDPSVEIISDLPGVISIPLDTASESLNTYAGLVADKIDAHIDKTRISLNEDRVRWLSLMKCKPAQQQKMIYWIKSLEEFAKKTWDVRYERHGVLWGPPDNFLLFSAPGVKDFVGFITALRTRFGKLLVQVDSRLVFPNKYWHQDSPASAKCHQLVMLSCAPQHVEAAYDALVDAAKHPEKRGTTDIDIVTVGVATGEADLFFITAAASEHQHRAFIEKQLHENILLDGWLTHNTNSMVIT
jgi:hypothetical protein